MNTTNLFRGALLGLVLVGSSMLMGCGSSGSGEVTGTLATQRSRWSQQNLTSYRFRFRWNCFCTPEFVRPVEITVREKNIVSISDPTSGTSLDPASFSRYRTISGLFDLLQEAAELPADRIDVTYDAELAYPTTAFVDYSVRTADEEIGFAASMLVPLQN